MEFPDHARVPKGSPTKFPTGIGGQATRKRRILEVSCGLKKVVTQVSHKGVILDPPRSGPKKIASIKWTLAGRRATATMAATRVQACRGPKWSRRGIYTRSLLRSEHSRRQRRCTTRNTTSPEETRGRTKRGQNSGTINRNKIENSYTQHAECKQDDDDADN